MEHDSVFWRNAWSTAAKFDIAEADRDEMIAYFVKAAEHLRNDTGLPISGPKT